MKVFHRVLWAHEGGGILETTTETNTTTTIGQRPVTLEEIKDLIFQKIIDRHMVVWEKLAAM